MRTVTGASIVGILDYDRAAAIASLLAVVA
jgi:hypothetical protein